MLSSISNLGMENQLVVIIEGLTDFDEMIAHGFDLQRHVSQNGWDNFFDMLYSPTYHNMIKEYWVNAVAQELNLECVIMYVVSGVTITINPTSIVNAINCKDECVTPDILFLESSLPPHLIFDNLSGLLKVFNLNSMSSVWFKILILNFLPKNKNIDNLDIDEKDFLLLLNSYLKTNLPRVLFGYLKITLISFHKGKSLSIPYGQVLLELFIQQGVEKTTVEVTSQIWGDKLKIP